MNKRLLLIAASAIFLAAIINLFFIVNAYIPSSSMAITIEKGSFVIGNRLSYLNSAPECGDIVFFKKDSISKATLIKRIIATPGQRFSMADGRVYINGALLEEPYVHEFSDEDFNEITVPENSYIVLGDNRMESEDSRSWEDPYITKENIKAKAKLMWFPKFKIIDTE